MNKNKLEKYIVQVEGLQLKGSGVLCNYHDEVYIFTAKHNLAYKENQKIKKIDIRELIKHKDDIKIYPHTALNIEDVIELEKSLDILILKIDKNSIDGIEISDLFIFEDELTDSLPCTIVGYPKIRNDKSLEFFDCKYELSDNSILEVHSDKVSALNEKQKEEDLVGLSGGGAFVENNGQIYFLGIQIRYEGFSNLECINLQKLKDRIDDKLIKSNIEAIEDEIKLDSGKSFKIKMVKVDLPDKSLYVSIYPVTFEEYDLFCDDTARSIPDDEGNKSVINVDWNDAMDYCTWLKKKVDDGYEYRLPTIQEWEYIANKNLNKNDYSEEIGLLGICDMYGKLLEWTCRDNYLDKNEYTRIAKGSSYRKSRKYIYDVTKYEEFIPTEKNDEVTFRVIREYVI